MSRILLWTVMMLVFSSSNAFRYQAQFNNEGKVVYPDDYLIYLALKSDAQGHKNDAEWQLKRAASFGNKDAQYLMGKLYLQKEQKIKGHAWLKLAGNKVGKSGFLIEALESDFTANDLSRAAAYLAELKITHNHTSAIKNRLKWAKQQKFTGTRIGGYIPPGLQIDNGSIDNNMTIYGDKVKNLFDEYVYNYRYDRGEVIIKELEVVDTE